jgi:rhamnosyltransferase
MNPEAGVTVAMLTRDGTAFIERVLDAVEAQRTDRQIEIVAVDSGSQDNTVGVLESRGVRVMRVAREEFDWGRARDLAFQESRSDIVVNLSQDAVPAHVRWLENLVCPVENVEVGVSCGSSIPDADRGFCQFPWEKNGYFYFTREMRKFTERYGRGVSFSNSAVRREVWERLRIDPQPIGEDFQFQTKLVEAGLQVVFPEDAPVLHHHNYPLNRLWMRCWNEGLALRTLGCPYSEWDLVRDLASLSKYVQWLREIRRGSLSAAADFTYPVLRPLAVYVGSRFGRRHVWR